MTVYSAGFFSLLRQMTDAVLHFFSSSDLAHFVVTWRMLDSSIAFSRLQTPSVYR